MNNVESVVRERNKAYYQLETGETGERPGKVIHDKIGTNSFQCWKYFLFADILKLIFSFLGLKHWRNLTQHYTPKHRNKKWHHKNPMGYDPKEVEQFHKLFKEKNRSQYQGQNKYCGFIGSFSLKSNYGIINCWNYCRLTKRYVRGLLRRFPNMDLEYLKEQYPHFDLESELEKHRTQGHFEKRSNIGNN